MIQLALDVRGRAEEDDDAQHLRVTRHARSAVRDHPPPLSSMHRFPLHPPPCRFPPVSCAYVFVEFRATSSCCAISINTLTQPHPTSRASLMPSPKSTLSSVEWSLLLHSHPPPHPPSCAHRFPLECKYRSDGGSADEEGDGRLRCHRRIAPRTLSSSNSLRVSLWRSSRLITCVSP